MTTHLSQTKAN